MRLKENNLRIRFQDSSTGHGNPTNDWQITANDSANGCDEYFAVQDIDSATMPFIIEAGAATGTFVIDENDRVGIGTNSPTAELHVEDNVYFSGELELGSSREFETNIRALELEAAVEALDELQLVKYTHKRNPGEESVGFIAEEMPDLVAENDRQSLNHVKIIALLTKVIQKQQKILEEQEDTVLRLARRFDELREEYGKTSY